MIILLLSKFLLVYGIVKFQVSLLRTTNLAKSGERILLEVHVRIKFQQLRWSRVVKIASIDFDNFKASDRLSQKVVFELDDTQHTVS